MQDTLVEPLDQKGKCLVPVLSRYLKFSCLVVLSEYAILNSYIFKLIVGGSIILEIAGCHINLTTFDKK